ncbi:hypothetical protein O4J56_09235 [Nocardiopsis sp. RSe5-2]|uniref:Secreted protein n=1 Tax=Nocardiopsis endophytica TaxID=3018445 RepID=A0ABT4U2Y0_9ACTN|nr:hypothetical protein [Nocardiopsis endophytica]MDA2810815.1 hypothetical protein [Nocardiopsis endophytica]
MGDVLSALIPPAVVATVFCAFVVKLLRKEMAPRTSDGRPVGGARAEASATSPQDAGSTSGTGGHDGARAGEGESPAEQGPEH